MLKIILILFVLAVVSYILLKYLISQSKHPSGFVGRIMMRIWNKAYLPMAQWALSVLPKKSYENILDIGVGNGASTAYLGQLFPNSQVKGLDISTEAISQAQQRYRQENITFEVMDVSQLAYPDNSFALICAFQTHFHWPDLTQAMLEIKRVLTNDGLFLIACEQSKINYYLPDLKERDAFVNYLTKIGLRLLDDQRQAAWVCYMVARQ
ncbi:class I SAM-dependent methyltransferase [Streptococcus caviae]|uniref:class I SAM-dependent methyltransferase n=1 Tax=Streptococcus sp. 'caviae' TaxID=1915004 RepID=UPI00094BAD84|nr:class I SAM-dependent methyltransferase [Streptococcus sp. 'caviae']OLN84181.1 SAM-dependent methyltransferase [Streptococcus sp. 'caviae']